MTPESEVTMITDTISAQCAMLVAHVASLNGEGKVAMITDTILAHRAKLVAHAASLSAEWEATTIQLSMLP